MIREILSTVGLFFASLLGIAPESVPPPVAPPPVSILQVERHAEPAVLGTTTPNSSPSVATMEAITRAELDSEIAALRSEFLAITAAGRLASPPSGSVVSSDLFRLQVDRIYDSVGRSVSNTNDAFAQALQAYMPLSGGSISGSLFVADRMGIGTTTPWATLSVTGTGTAAGIAFAVADVNNDPRLVVQDNGNVGIGTTTPGANLVINGTTGQNLFQIATSTNQGVLTVNANGSVAVGPIPSVYYGRVTINVATNQNIVFRSDQFTGARIEAVNDAVSANIPLELVATRYSFPTGNVGIASTTPWRRLSVTGTVGFDGLGSTGGTQTLCLTANKEVVTNNGECVSSSAELKEDIRTISLSATDVISAMRPVSFKYLDAQWPTYGFIAEDVAAIDSRFIGYFDQGGSPRTVNTASILAVTVKAVQEVASKLASLFNTTERHDAELQQLKDRVSELEARTGINSAPPSSLSPLPTDSDVEELVDDTTAGEGAEDATTLSDHATPANSPHDDAALVE